MLTGVQSNKKNINKILKKKNTKIVNLSFFVIKTKIMVQNKTKMLLTLRKKWQIYLKIRKKLNRL